MVNSPDLYVQNINSFSHLLDRLCIENIKLGDFTRRLELEQRKGTNADTNLVNNLYRSMRLANESRGYVKNAIDKLLHTVIKSGKYETLEEIRTHILPDDPVEDLTTREDPGAEFSDTEPNK